MKLSGLALNSIYSPEMILMSISDSSHYKNVDEILVVDIFHQSLIKFCKGIYPEVIKYSLTKASC